MVKKISIVFLMMLMLTFVTAIELEAEQIGEDLEIYQECNNCTYCNFTRVKYQGENIFENIEAVEDNTYYSYLIGGGNITEKGVLTYCYDCGNADEKDTGCIDVPLTYNGKQLTTETSMMYLGFIVFLVFILGLLFMSLYYIPKDIRDDDGFVMNVSQLAYIRPVVMGLCWIVLTAIVYISSNVAIAYLDTGILGSFLFLVFRLMFMSNFVLIPLCIILMIQRITLASEMKELIERGVKFA